MLPLVIGAAVASAFIFKGHSEPEYRRLFHEDSDIADTHRQLRAAGVANWKIDRGVQCHNGQGWTYYESIPRDQEIHPNEVYKTAQDLFLKYPDNDKYREIANSARFNLNKIFTLPSSNPRVYESVLKIDSSNVAAYVGLGDFDYQAGNFGSAASNYDSALCFDPSLEKTQVEIRRQKIKNIQEEIQPLAEAFEKNPDIEHVRALVLAYRKHGIPEKALGGINAGVMGKPDDVRTSAAAQWGERLAKEYSWHDGASNSIQRKIDLAPFVSADLQFELGLALLRESADPEIEPEDKNQKLARAEQSFNRVMELAPEANKQEYRNKIEFAKKDPRDLEMKWNLEQTNLFLRQMSMDVRNQITNRKIQSPIQDGGK